LLCCAAKLLIQIAIIETIKGSFFIFKIVLTSN
jgi:hypothetical protein